jgi:4-diphosphocytidyl-2-C-methyl-D-erythritol kinase
MREEAPAKVNLFLHVVGRRADGYHLLDSLVVFAAAADTLTATPAATIRLDLGGPFAGAVAAGAGNLVLRAADALAVATGASQGAAIHLSKQLPVAAGLGGGSADAAAALRLLCALWQVAPGRDQLATIAGGLGADVPVCLAGQAARLRGIGERLDPAPCLPPCGIVLINPGTPLLTGDVFAARARGERTEAALPQCWPDACAMAADLARLHNDLEEPAIGLCPAVAAVLAVLRRTPGCLLARMSGSGATCFGLFGSAAEAEQAAAALARPGWWSWGGPLRA